MAQGFLDPFQVVYTQMRMVQLWLFTATCTLKQYREYLSAKGLFVNDVMQLGGGGSNFGVLKFEGLVKQAI